MAAPVRAAPLAILAVGTTIISVIVKAPVAGMRMTVEALLAATAPVTLTRVAAIVLWTVAPVPGTAIVARRMVLPAALISPLPGASAPRTPTAAKLNGTISVLARWNPKVVECAAM